MNIVKNIQNLILIVFITIIYNTYYNLYFISNVLSYSFRVCIDCVRV